MSRNNSAPLCFKYFSRYSSTYARQLCSKPLLAEEHSAAGSSRYSIDYLEEKMQAQQQQLSWHRNGSSIYRVPAKLRKVDPKAYDPHYVSIGPYHRGSPNLQDAEKLKQQSLNCLVGLGMHKLVDDIRDLELEARECYSDEVKLSTDDFVNVMLLDGCFIVYLFKELSRNNFSSSNSSLLSKRWMLPVVRRDLITLENQLPMIVLKKIFDATRAESLEEETSLEELALRFFDPLMPREEGVLRRSIKSITKHVDENDQNFQHLLDIFHSSITPTIGMKRGKEPHMHRSVIELKEAGIKVRVLETSQPLELKFERGVLRMPSLQIDNHTACFFRNIVAYEQCHYNCKPDMTTYLFFLDKLINSTEDVGLLHYERVIQHTLGSNKQVAKLVNNLCIEVEHDGHDSYLYEVVERLNFYSDRWFIKVKARLKHDYFSNLWVGISTLAGLFLLYLTLLQASCNAIEAEEKEHRKKKTGPWLRVNTFLVHPIDGTKQMVVSTLKFIARGAVERNEPPPEPQESF